MLTIPKILAEISGISYVNVVKILTALNQMQLSLQLQITRSLEIIR